MAKNRRSKTAKSASKTRWPLIIGIVIVSVIGLFALLFLSLNSETEAFSLTDYCLETPSSCIFSGSGDSEVDVLEVSDLGCTHCRTFHTQTKSQLDESYVDRDRIRYIALPYALSASTMPAANASMCANDQGKYADFVATMYAQFDDPDYLTSASINAIAETLDIDMDAFSQCTTAGTHISTLRDNIDAARKGGVTATPTFFVNDNKLEGAHPFESFQQQIEAALNS